jgi:hypothetical protein
MTTEKMYLKNILAIFGEEIDIMISIGNAGGNAPNASARLG